MPLRHIVLFRVYEGVARERVAEAVQGLEDLAVISGILEWTIRLSSDERKGVVIVENALFESAEALAAFSAHPDHEVSAQRLRTMSDWWIGDYEEPPHAGGPTAG